MTTAQQTEAAIAPPPEVEGHGSAKAVVLQADELAARYADFRISAPDQLQIAGDDLRDVATRIKAIEEERLAITRPMDAAKKRVMQFFARPIDRLREVETTIKREMSRYKAEEDRKAREQQRIADERARKERERLQREAAEAQRREEEKRRAREERERQEAEARRAAEEERLRKEREAAEARERERQAELERQAAAARDERERERIAEEKRQAEAEAQAERDRLAREAQEAQERAEREEAEREERARAEREQAAARAQILEDRAAATVAPVIASAADQKVAGVHYRDQWDFRIVDAAKVPRQYLVPDESKIRKVIQALKADHGIEGVEATCKKVPVARRK